MKTIKELREEFNSLHKQTSDTIAKATAEDRDLTTEETTANDTAFKRMESIKAKVDADNRLAACAFAAATAIVAAAPVAPVNGTVQVPATTPGQQQFDAGNGSVRVANETPEQLRQRFNRAFNEWGKYGNAPAEFQRKQLTPELMAQLPPEIRQQFTTINTATQSGILLPTDVVQPLTPSYINVFRDALSKYGLTPFNTENTAVVNLPILDASAGGAITQTGTTATADNPPSLSKSIVLSPTTYASGPVWFANQQLMAVDFDLFSATLPQMEFSKELGLESAMVSGIVADSNITNVNLTSTVSGFTFNDLVAADESLPKKYQALKVIILSAKAHAAFRGLVTTTGQPIMTWVDPQGKQVLSLQNTPVLRSDYLSAFGANNIVGIVLSFMGFRLRDCAGQTVARYTQYPLRENQTGYNLFAYHAWGYAPDAMALIKCPAS